MSAPMDPHSDLQAHYTRALDEIYILRAALAYEAELMSKRHSVRGGPIDSQANRMRMAANGHVQRAYMAFSAGWSKKALDSAGADTALTRHQWETASSTSESEETA